MRLIPLLALLALARADDPSPLSFRGSWTGTVAAGFALADRGNFDSWECFPGNSRAGTGTVWQLPAHAVIISETEYVEGGWASEEIRVASSAAAFYWPGRNETRTLGWAAFNATSGIATLRFSPTDVECHFMRVVGSGDSRTLTILTIGGAAFTWESQCDPLQYRLGRLSDAENFDEAVADALLPFCETIPAPAETTVPPRWAYATSLVARYRLAVPSASPSPAPPALSPSPSPFPAGIDQGSNTGADGGDGAVGGGAEGGDPPISSSAFGRGSVGVAASLVLIAVAANVVGAA